MIRILFLADTHLGFDFPFRPRVKRRRRGPDFFDNFRKALEPALSGEIDAVVHGGDLLFRSRVSARLVDLAFEPLKEAADLGVKVFLVPGNHERSRIPFGLLAAHENIHIFSHPTTFLLDKGGLTAALSGFPFCRHNARGRFPELLDQTGWRQASPVHSVRLLCVHQAFEGARVGPVNYTFRRGDDVIRAADIPGEFSAVLAGHIHRHQVLRTGLSGIPLKTPVLIPGSIERTSFAEKDETKGYMTLELDHSLAKGSALARWHFHQLPARPMEKIAFDVTGLSLQNLRRRLECSLQKLDPDSVVKIIISGCLERECLSVFRTAELRAICPESMNVELSFVSEPNVPSSTRRRGLRNRLDENSSDLGIKPGETRLKPPALSCMETGWDRFDSEAHIHYPVRVNR